MEGWIKLHRKIINHWIFADPLYFRAWIYCLLRANHDKKKIMIKGELIEINRGEFVTSLKNFSNETELSVRQVRTFFSLLEKDKMIHKNPTRQATKLTICNYDSYNDMRQSERQPDDTQATHGRQQTRTNKNDKNKEEIFKEEIFSFSKYDNSMLGDFYNYWSEHDGNGKMKYEKQKTWETSKRLATWQKNQERFNGKKTQKGVAY